jgi:hypothetical protein
MKNYFKLIFSLTLLIGLSFSLKAQDVITQKQSKFVSKFVGAVNVQKKNKAYKCVSKDFKDKFSGHKDEVLANLFAGKISKSGEFSKVPFNKIYNIRLVSVREVQEGITLYNFLLVTPEGPVESSLYLIREGKKGKFGFKSSRN